MKAWAAPVVDGIRQDDKEVEIATDGLTVLPHTLPWHSIAYRYEYAPGEEIPSIRTDKLLAHDSGDSNAY